MYMRTYMYMWGNHRRLCKAMRLLSLTTPFLSLSLSLFPSRSFSLCTVYDKYVYIGLMYVCILQFEYYSRTEVNSHIFGVCVWQ